MYLDLPPADWRIPAEWIAANAVPSSLNARWVAYNARHGQDSVWSEGLLQVLEPMVSKAAGCELHGAYSFSWVYGAGAYIKAHLDRKVTDWFVSIPISMDKPWGLHVEQGTRWIEYTPEIGSGVLAPGATTGHGRIAYDGEQAIVVILSYFKSAAEAREKRQKLREPLVDFAKGTAALDEIGFAWRGLPGMTRPEATLTPLFLDGSSIAELRESVIMALPDDNPNGTVVMNEICDVSFELQHRLADLVEFRSGFPVLPSRPLGYHYRSCIGVLRQRDPHGIDWRILAPLDERAASWPIMTDNGPITCPLGYGVLLPGSRMDWWRLMTDIKDAVWISMPYREVPARLAEHPEMWSDRAGPCRGESHG